MIDDDDDFYADSINPKPITSVSKPIPLEQTQATNGVVAHLENEAANEDPLYTSENNGLQGEEENQDVDESESDDDVEIIMNPVARSLDFRQTTGRPLGTRAAPPSTPSQPRAPQPTLTTEYTPISRGGPAPRTGTPSAPQVQHQSNSLPPTTSATPSRLQPQQSQAPGQPQIYASSAHPSDDGVDTSNLLPVTAPPSHPAIDPDTIGILDGRSILEVDLNAMADKPWRRPGSDISDWFNYGFDEISWEAYCYRRRDLGDLAAVLKTNVINFAGMQEDQLNALPPEVRTMVMTGATAMMNNGGPNAGMMPMMDMSMMGPMGMGMGMNNDMGMGGQMIPVDGRAMMQDNQVQQSVGMSMGNGTPEQQVGNGISMMQDTFNNQANPGMMGINISGDFGMQDQNPMAQQMYPMEVPATVTPVPNSNPRGGTPVPFRGGRGATGLGRGRGFVARGRGRGYGIEGVPPPVAVRPASPLPPGVPTGPRNQNKYKDRDGNAPAVDGLDYGGGGAGKDPMGKRTPSGEPEERSSSRKRRSSPGLDEGRGPKRR